MNQNNTMPRVIRGRVVSNKMTDTITLTIERKVKHPKYGKYMKRTTKVHAHDPGNTAGIGDLVVVKECPPISKKKSWVLVEIKEKAEQV